MDVIRRGYVNIIFIYSHAPSTILYSIVYGQVRYTVVQIIDFSRGLILIVFDAL